LACFKPRITERVLDEIDGAVVVLLDYERIHSSRSGEGRRLNRQNNRIYRCKYSCFGRNVLDLTDV